MHNCIYLWGSATIVSQAIDRWGIMPLTSMTLYTSKFSCKYVPLPYLTFGYLQKFLKIRDGYVMAANPSFFKQEVQCWNTYKLWTINKYWCLFCQKSQIFHHNTLFDWWGICIYLYIYIYIFWHKTSICSHKSHAVSYKTHKSQVLFRSKPLIFHYQTKYLALPLYRVKCLVQSF